MRKLAVLMFVLSIIALAASFSFVPLSSSEPEAGSLRSRRMPEKPTRAVIPAGYSRSHIEVKFLDDVDVGLGQDGSPIDRSQRGLQSLLVRGTLETITQDGGSWSRMPGAPENVIDRLMDTAEMNLGREIADLNNYFILAVPPGVDAELWIDQLNALDEVEIATPMPLEPPPPVESSPPVVPDYEPLQGYLNAAPDGIDARHSWTVPGGTGSNVTICDMEYGWYLDHEDFPAGIPTWIPEGYTGRYSSQTHGTMTLGVMVSLDNGWGTTGAAHGATAAVAPVVLDDGDGGGFFLGTAMTNVIANLSEGDVILIETGVVGPMEGKPIPVEWIESWYNVILTAVGNGIHVVEAANNGYQNLDDPIYSTGNGGHWPFLPENDSGAIIAGAGAVPAAYRGEYTDRSRLGFSNYGSRVNLQGWGEHVVTTGAGNLGDYGPNLKYTHGYGGTSAASPIVASAVALVESRYEEITGGEPLTPARMRSVLIETGSPQQSGTYPVTEHIGPRPNVRAALAALGLVTCTCDFDPDFLNVKSKGRWVTCYIELPEGYDPSDIDVSTVMLNNAIRAESSPTSVGDNDSDGTPDRMVKFGRSGLIALIGGADDNPFEVTISGELLDGTTFTGTDFIGVIDPEDGAGGSTNDEAVSVKINPTAVGGTARISYELATAGPVSLRIFDAAGRLVRTLEAGNKAAGTHTVTWDRRMDNRRTVGSGVYFIRLEQRGKASVQKMLILE